MSKNYQDRTQEQPMETTVVIFRVDREGVVFALFPELPDRSSRLAIAPATSRSASIVPPTTIGCIADSRPATPAEYADLFVELQHRGYEMKIRQRATSAMHERCRQSAVVG